MRIAEVKIYKYEELSAEAKEKALEEMREWSYDTFDTELLSEQFIEVAEKEGFMDCEFMWELNYRQGDGVSFVGKVDLKKYLSIDPILKRDFDWLLHKDVSFFVKRITSQYAHHNTVEVDYEINDDVTEKQEDDINALKDTIEETKDDVCRKCKKIGYEEFEFRQSEKCLKEDMEANDIEFLEDGRMSEW